MPRRNISAWKVCMSWQSGQRKWCRAARRAWPWRRGNISRGALRIAPGLGMTPGLRGWVVLGTMLLRPCGNAAYLDGTRLCLPVFWGVQVSVGTRTAAGGTGQGAELPPPSILQVLLLADVVQPDDVRVVQRRGRPGLAEEPLDHDLVEPVARGEHLQRDPPPADTAHLGTAVRCWASVPCTRR